MSKFPFQHHGNRGGVIAVILALLAPAAFAVPTISQQPQSTTGTAGTALTLSVAATGSGPLTYQWRRNGFALASATAATLTLARPSQTDSGFYDVLINDGQGTVTSTTAQLRVGPSAYPDGITPAAGTPIALEHARGGYIQRVKAAADGSFYVCGDFSSIAGERRWRIARFTAEGVLDPTFAPAIFDGIVSDLAVQRDGRVIVLGEFLTVDTTRSPSIARLLSDGRFDTSFQVGEAFGTLAIQNMRVAVGADDAIYVSGPFSSYQGRPSGGIVRILANGAGDNSFTPPSFSIAPSRMAIAPDGKIYCLATLRGTTKNNGICRLLANGSLDSTFDAGDGGSSKPTALLRLQDGRLVVSGAFSNYSGQTTPYGVVRLNETGAVDPTFAVTLPSVSGVLQQLPTGDLIFVSATTDFVTVNLSRIKLDGTPATGFTPPALRIYGAIEVTTTGRIVYAGEVGTGNGVERLPADVLLLDNNGRRLNSAVTVRFPARINAMKLLPDGKFLVGGDFSHWDGVAVAPLVRVNADLTRDPTFRATVNATHTVEQCALQPDGKIVIHGRMRDTTPAHVLRRLDADGSPDATFVSTQTSPLGASQSLTVLNDGRIAAADNYAANGVRLFAANGAVLATHEFGAQGGADNYPIFPAQGLNGQYYVTGNFTTWAGLPRPRLVRLNGDGTADPGFTFASGDEIPTGFDSEQNVTQSNGRILVATRSNGAKILGLKSTGQRDETFSGAVSPWLGYLFHTIQADDRILVWGQDNFPAQLVCFRLLANGARDSSFTLLGSPATLTGLHQAWTYPLTLDNGDMVAATAHGTLVKFNRVVGPVITAQPVAVARASGESATFSVAAVGAGTFTYQWFHNGEAIAGATGATLSLPRVLSPQTGQYVVAITNPLGTTRSAAALLTVDRSANTTSRLSNLSVRARSAGATPISTGFTVGGGSKELLIRGIGPGLTQFGTPGVAVDPRLAIFVNNAQVDQNDNWAGAPALTTAFNAVGAFPVPANSLDAAVVRSVSGSASAQLRSTGDGGVTLTEIYDTAPLSSSGARLTNVSVLSYAGTDADILIAGFNIVGSGNKELLIRGIGPGLAGFNVAGALVDPQLAVYSGATRIAENGDWGGTSVLTAATSSVGAFPLAANSKDAAIVVTLPAGSYSVQLSGVGSTTGEGLIEVYELP